MKGDQRRLGERVVLVAERERVPVCRVLVCTYIFFWIYIDLDMFEAGRDFLPSFPHNYSYARERNERQREKKEGHPLHASTRFTSFMDA